MAAGQLKRDLGDEAESGPRGYRPRGRLSRRALAVRVAGLLSVAVAVALVAGTLTAYLKYRAVWESIHRVTISHLGHRPPRYATAVNSLNILVFGSDSRAGLTLHQQVLLHVGHDGCGCSDTIMVVHISPGRRRVTVLNIPRDTMVPVYSCPAGPGLSGQQGYPGALEQINTSLEHGGPACLWKTVEHVTGIRLDHFIQLQFTGVVKVINDLGGVNVCVPFNISDPNSGLHITKGVRHIYGLVFLQFWRARYSLADGTDLKRIQRDDLLLAEALRGVLHDGLLSHPSRLVSVVTDAASALTTDSELTQSAMLAIGSSLHGISAGDVQFIETQTAPYPPAPNQVELVQPQDGRLFSAIARDSTLPGPAKPALPGTGQPGMVRDQPAQVRVEVLNGSGVSGQAATVAGQLASRGFAVAGTTDATTASGAPDFSYTAPVVEYGPAADLPAARAVAAQVPGATIRQHPAATPGTVRLILGTQVTALVPQPSASPSPQHSVGNLAKNYGGITGEATCRTVGGAFTGPNSPGR
jgi:LCP family protein required for cell wall assembly